MALAVRLRCPFHSTFLGLRSCASQAAPASAPVKDVAKETAKETAKDTAKSSPKVQPQPIIIASETSSSTPRGGRAASIEKPNTFEVAHLGKWGDETPEKFIPVSRRLLIRRLIEDKSLLSETQSAKFEQFAQALNQSVAMRMVHHLDDMKNLYDPLDPDKDTITQHRLNRNEQLDHEFWLLRQLARVLEKANFRRLPHHLVSEEMREHDTAEGVRVSVNVNSYDTLQVWTRGKGTVQEDNASGHFAVRAAKWAAGAVKNRFYPSPPGSDETFKRVVLLVRQHTSNKLIMKIFRDIPCRRLETLLPDGRIVMSKLDRYMLLTGVSSGILTLSVKAIAFLLDMQLHYMWIGVMLVSITTFRAWLAFKNKRNAYLAQLTQTLYYHNVANNRAVLAQLSDRAADEQFKEALLLYSFVLSSGNDASKLPNGKYDVQRAIEEWLVRQFKLRNDSFRFDMSDAMSSLQRLALISERSRDATLLAPDISEAILLLQSYSYSKAAINSVSDVMEDAEGEIGEHDAAAPDITWK